MSQSVDVIVRRGGSTIDTLAGRPVRIMSSGDAGVVYGGVVHPLHEGDYIDVLEEAAPKESCLGYVESGDLIPYAPSHTGTRLGSVVSKWHVETNRYGNYLVFDGGEPTAEALVALMRSAGLGVRRWDTSSRPADDGYTYDWFIRLEFQGERDDCVRRIRKALRASRPSTTRTAPLIPEQRGPIEEQADTAPLAALNAKMMRKIGALETALSEQRDMAQAEQTRHNAAEAEYRRKLDRAQEQVRELDAKVSALGGELKSARDMSALSRKGEQRALEQLREQGAMGLDVDEAKREAAGWQELADEYAQDAAEAKAETAAMATRLDESESALDEIREQRDDLLRRLQDTETDLKEAQRGRRSSGRLSVDELLRWLWPELKLDPDSIEVLEHDFPQPTPILRALNRLANDDLRYRAVTCREVKESDGLREVCDHFATGDPDAGPMGRVYFRSLPDGRKFVLIHKKKDAKEQRRTWRRFAGRNLDILPSQKDQVQLTSAAGAIGS